MNNLLPKDDGMPDEIDFSGATRGLHHVSADAKVFLPTAIEQSVWEYFSRRAAEQGVGLPQLLSDVLKNDMAIRESD